MTIIDQVLWGKRFYLGYSSLRDTCKIRNPIPVLTHDCITGFFEGGARQEDARTEKRIFALSSEGATLGIPTMQMEPKCQTCELQGLGIYVYNLFIVRITLPDDYCGQCLKA